jgi:hypothetical protein
MCPHSFTQHSASILSKQLGKISAPKSELREGGRVRSLTGPQFHVVSCGDAGGIGEIVGVVEMNARTNRGEIWGACSCCNVLGSLVWSFHLQHIQCFRFLNGFRSLRAERKPIVSRYISCFQL